MCSPDQTLLRAVAVGAVLVTSWLPVAAVPQAGPPATRAGSLPLTFEANTGHFPRDVRFVARTGRTTIFITRTQMVLAVRGRGRGQSTALRLTLQGANAKAAATGIGRQVGVVNYFIGPDPKRWRTRVPTYSRVKLAGVYPGVDLVTYGGVAGRALEFDFVVRPGADPARIRMAVSGASSLRRVGERIVASTSCGDVTLKRPYAYQTVGGERRRVACSYTLERGTVAFQIARYDTARALIVDPTLLYSTYLGGVGVDQVSAIAVDNTGAAYVAGTTASASFPVSSGALQTTYGGGNVDAFVTKLNAAGTARLYSTYLGGGFADAAYSIAVDGSGYATVTGYCYSGFPTTAGAYQTVHTAGEDAFVARLSPNGASLSYSTLLGGAGSDCGNGVAIDATGAAYVAGWTDSANFPVTAGAFQASRSGASDGFVAKLSPSGSTLSFSTLLGGAGTESCKGLAVDSSGASYLVGTTGSSDYPTTAGSFQPAAQGSGDAFVTKLNAGGSALVFSGYLGGISTDSGTSIAVDASTAVYVTGYTSSRGFPTTVGAYQTAYGGGLTDAFVTKVNTTGSALIYSTLLGGSNSDAAYGAAVDGAGVVSITGNSQSGNYPTTPDAYQTVIASGTQNMVVTQLNSTGSALVYSTVIGGNSASGRAIALGVPGLVYAAGTAGSADFPTTPGAAQPASGGDTDSVIIKIGTPGTVSTSMSATGSTGQVGEMVELTAALTCNGMGVAGATVSFTTPNGATTPRTTNAAGLANLWYDIPAGATTAAFTAAFAGDAAYTASSDTDPVTVSYVAKVQALPASGRAGTAVTLAAYLFQGKAIVGIAGQQLTYRIDGGPATGFAALTAGAYGRTTSSYAIPGAMAAGAHAITVDWAGSAPYPAAQGTATLTVHAAALPTYVWVHSHGATVGIPTRLTCYLYEYRRNGDLVPLAGKPVAISVAGTSIGSFATASDGKASAYYTPTAAGAVAQGMSFAGDGTYASTSSSGTLTVGP